MLRTVGALAAVAAAAAAAPLPPTNLRTEYVTDPIVLDVAAPRFFWQLESAARGVNQTAFRVVVNSVTGGNATVWDSGVVYSNATTQIAYAGTPLISDSVYAWTVSWWDNTGAQSPWAEWARFGTGLMTQAEWTSGWIGCPLPTAGTPNYNQLRAEFSLDLPAGVTVVHARAYVSGLGYYALRVNGAWADQWPGVVDRPRLDPTWTTIEVRSLYNAYDLTRALSPTGPNAFAVFMGNGWPDVDPVPGNSSSSSVNRAVDPAGKLAAMEGLLDPWTRTGFQRRVRMQIHVRTSDGKSTVWTTSAAGASPWRCGSGALLDDSVYDGCVWDQRLYTAGWDLPGYKYDSGNWTAAVAVADPGGASKTTMTAQTMQA
jgi:alpha-L-rhamnosidase